MSEYVSQCGCKIHITQWTSKRKLVSIKYCQKHSGEPPAQPSASEGERVEQRIGMARVQLCSNDARTLRKFALQLENPQALFGYYGAKLEDELCIKGAEFEIIARLVPTKGGADHE